MNLPVIDKTKVVNFTKIRDQFHRAYDHWQTVLNPRPLFPVVSQPKTNTKLSKESDRSSGYSIHSVFLAPADSSGYEMCLWRSQDCTDICLNCSGKGALSSVQQARIRKTQRLVESPADFMHSLLSEMQKAEDKCAVTPVMRLNGTSDLDWRYMASFLFSHFSRWKFYDYTKSFRRAYEQDPNTWDITLSYSGHNWADCERCLTESRARVAVVFDTSGGKPLPTKWRGFDVIKGDADDLRFLDRRDCIVGLSYKVVTLNGKRMSASSWNSPFIVSE